MSTKTWVDKHHYRVTTDDGRKSYLYEAGGFMKPDTCIEIAEHREDGTTDAYEYKSDPVGEWLFGASANKGEKKND